MRREDAIKKLTKLLDKKFAFEYDVKAPDADEKAEALAQLRLESAKKTALGEQLEARRKKLLEADEEYQQLLSEHKATREVCEKLSYTARRERVTVGTMGKLFFSVAAQGDSWEDVIKKVQEAKSRGQLHIAGDL